MDLGVLISCDKCNTITYMVPCPCVPYEYNIKGYHSKNEFEVLNSFGGENAALAAARMHYNLNIFQDPERYNVEIEIKNHGVYFVETNIDIVFTAMDLVLMKL